MVVRQLVHPGPATMIMARASANILNGADTIPPYLIDEANI